MTEIISGETVSSSKVVCSFIYFLSWQNKFAWSDSYVTGSLLDPQNMNFAERATDLWMHAAKLRECVHTSAGCAAGENDVPAERKCDASGGGAGVLSTILEQVGIIPRGWSLSNTNRLLYIVSRNGNTQPKEYFDDVLVYSPRALIIITLRLLVFHAFLVQAARATEISKGPCSIALAKICMKLGEIRKVNGNTQAIVVYFSPQYPNALDWVM